MIYWVTNSITTSQRLFKESLTWESHIEGFEGAPISRRVSIGVAIFPNERVRVPKALLKDTYKNIVQYQNLPRGGHFAALEEPQLLAGSVRSLVKVVLNPPPKQGDTYGQLYGDLD
jgi:hypothetical protein